MKPSAEPVIRKATTFRIEPRIQADLVLIGKALKVPLNRLVNDALASYAEKRLAEVTSGLEETLRILKSRQAKDPDFELAITAFAKAEAARAKSDSSEGKVADVKRGPVQTRIRKLLKA